MADVIRERIEIVQGPSGPKPRVAGHRIRVQDVAIWHEKLGISPDEIVNSYRLTQPDGARLELIYEVLEPSEMLSRVEFL